MIKPNLDIEKRLWASAINCVGGIDEAGRGSWAGPVVAAVVVLPKDHILIDGIADSKLISAKKRDEYYNQIIDKALDYGVGVVPHNIIDEIGILNATKQACVEAIGKLKEEPEYLLTDALDLTSLVATKQEAIIHGDQKVYSISCASIIAKVTRDRIMSSLDDKYSVYEFDKHKGYGTKLHQQLLAEHGISDIHRKSYRPIVRLDLE